MCHRSHIPNDTSVLNDKIYLLFIGFYCPSVEVAILVKKVLSVVITVVVLEPDDCGVVRVTLLILQYKLTFSIKTITSSNQR